jgi:cytochrome oxidase Cu insertion factor (SCO1/SenC/PrrC family)
MKNGRVSVLGLLLVLPILMAACAGTTTPAPESEASRVTAPAKPTITGPRTGDIAPDFTLPDSNGNIVHLADELDNNRMVILIFYHAYT